MAACLGPGSVASASARVDQSTTYQADAAHDRTLSGPPAGPLVQLWARTLPGPASYPVVAAGVVYVSTSGPTSAYGTTLYALDAAPGANLWSHPLGGTYDWSALSYDAGRVFAVNENGLLSGFEAASGTLYWSASFQVSTRFPRRRPRSTGSSTTAAPGLAGRSMPTTSAPAR